MKPIIKISFAAAFFALVLVGCSNKINQTGAWLVSTDTSLVPVYFNSTSDSSKITSSQVNTGLATGTGTSLILGKIPWTEADLLLRFSALDPVDSAQKILSTTITLYRSGYLLQPNGGDITSTTFQGYMMDSVWNAATSTWDSVQAIGYGTQNIITSSSFSDSTIVFQIDSSATRQWARATHDTTVPNNGFIIRPQNDNGIVSVYGPVYGVTGYVPMCTIIYMKGDTLDTTSVSLSYATSVAKTSIETTAPQGPYRIVQAGTGERANFLFDLSRIPKYAIVNRALLTLREDSTSQLPYTRKYVADTLVAYYTIDAATNQVNSSAPSYGYPITDTYTFDVTTIVQHMINSQNYGFMIAAANELNNTDLRFIYDENAPDSLKPKLTITYTPTSRR